VSLRPRFILVPSRRSIEMLLVVLSALPGAFPPRWPVARILRLRAP
jgi:hypothetical protein